MSSSSGLSSGAVGGIAAGIVGGLLILGALVFFFIRRRPVDSMRDHEGPVVREQTVKDDSSRFYPTINQDGSVPMVGRY